MIQGNLGTHPISVDGEWKGMRGGKDSKSTSNSLSFSITKSVATKDKTSGGCYIPTHCPRLPANVKATLSPPIGQMDSAICDERGGVCVGGGVTGRPCAGGRVSLQYLLVSLPPRRSPRVVATHGSLSGAGTRTGDPVYGGAR